MGLSRGLANLVSLGAISKVDSAEKSYRNTYNQFERYRKLGDEVKSLQNDVNNLRNELNKKHRIIHKIYSNKNIRHKLSSIEVKALEEYKSCVLQNTSVPDYSPRTIGFGEWEDSVIENFSMIMATILIPIGGIIGAHESANEKVEQIQEREREILKSIEKIRPQAEKMYKIKKQYELIIQTLTTVRNVVRRYDYEG